MISFLFKEKRYKHPVYTQVHTVTNLTWYVPIASYSMSVGSNQKAPLKYGTDLEPDISV